jgi:4-hydroxybenzoate polyprenyltransferase/phosphoserine phosphatase
MKDRQAPDLATMFSDPSALGRPLCVDLDGTLVTTDTLAESVVLLLRRAPWSLVSLLARIPYRARFKAFLASRVQLDPEKLPYRHDLVSALRDCRQKGRTLVLATAAHRSIAEGVAAHLGVFDAVHASDDSRNLKSTSKRDALVAAYGPRGFDYVGDSTADVEVFESAEQGVLVGASRGAASHAAQNVTVLSRKPSILRAGLKELRPHQWSKNALVFLPPLLAPGAVTFPAVGRAAVAFVAFSLCASAGYVINDVIDIEADRIHRTKRLRSLASGDLPILLAPFMILGLLAASFGLAAGLLSAGFVAMLGAYLVATLGYSLSLKKLLLVDVLVLAGLYTHRILSGGVATGVHVSAWLLGFSMFLFTSLAFAKRYVELLAATSDDTVKSRGYVRQDIDMVNSMGVASGYIAALVFMLYVDSAAVRAIYRLPVLLWLVLPVLLYWLGRIWLLAGRGQMQDDPVKFAIKDGQSRLCAVIIALIMGIARFLPHGLLGTP